jgi:ring-1,2-phenylacetyl-CoA epoxidase subunit PaaA
MERIRKEERFHERQGYEIMAALARGTSAQKQMAQNALDRWWWPTLMMFGPPDDASVHGDTLKRWGVKQKTNDELRQWFVDLAVPQAQALPLAIPDPALRFDNDTKHWQIGPIDWDEFWRVVKGGGTCNRERLRARLAAHEEGKWVREAAEAYTKRRHG